MVHIPCCSTKHTALQDASILISDLVHGKKRVWKQAYLTKLCVITWPQCYSSIRLWFSQYRGAIIGLNFISWSILHWTLNPLCIISKMLMSSVSQSAAQLSLVSAAQKQVNLAFNAHLTQHTFPNSIQLLTCVIFTSSDPTRQRNHYFFHRRLFPVARKQYGVHRLYLFAYYKIFTTPSFCQNLTSNRYNLKHRGGLGDWGWA